jgi:hypothetical protein
LANWDKYNSSPKDFDFAAAELISLSKIDLRGRIQRRFPILWLLSLIPFLPSRWRLTPTRLLAKYYDQHLFHGLTAAEVESPKELSFLILSTNLGMPGLTCFGRQSVLHVPFGDKGTPEPISAEMIPLAQVVAASSAYPGFFTPLLLSDTDIGSDDGSFGKEYFTDAGIFDNLGLYGLRTCANSIDQMLASDAGRSFVPQKEYEFGLLRTALRAVDILMFRIRQLDLERAASKLPVTLISISGKSDAPGASSSAIQAQLQSVRTDFDKFSDIEITELMRHGYYVAAKMLASEQGGPSAYPEWDIPEAANYGQKQVAKFPRAAFRMMPNTMWRWAKTATQTDIARKLQASSRRRWRVFSARDWVSWVQLALVALVVGLVVQLSNRIADEIDNVVAGFKAAPLRRYSPPKWTEPPSVAIETVQELPRPTNKGFEIKSDDRVWDLRQLQGKPRSPGVMEAAGPVLMTRISTLIKHDPTANQYRYLYQTAANNFSAWSPKQNVPVKLYRSEQKTVSGNNILTSYELELDVSDIKVDEQFVLEAQAKTADAPWDRNNSWIGMSVTDPMLAASMRIIFPKYLPYKRPFFRKYPNDTTLEAQAFDGIVLDRAEEKELLWRVDHPQVGWTYRVQWDWE